MELQHFSHPHPLVFFKYETVASEEVDPEAVLCPGCEKPVDGWCYGCNQCEFYLHKGCAELELAPKIRHPFHPKHLLTLLPETPYFGGCGICHFCGKELGGFVYNCYDCEFDLHINCALLQSSIAANFPHSLHPHPLFFIQNHNDEVDSDCARCQKPISGPIFHCSDCPYPTLFNLHKECAELDLAPQIQHPFHPEHPLTLLPESPYFGECNLCGKAFRGFVYNCYDCKFDLHINCALLQSSIAANFPNSLHPHPLFFVQNYNKEVELDCPGCQKPISGPFYHCSDCTYPTLFNLHKECAELSLEINHPYDRKHPLTLLPQPPTHPQKCSCSLCRTQWSGFVYSCSLCNFDLSLADFLSQQTLTDASHEHPWMLISRKMSFICDFCGTAGEHSPYYCATCHLLVHKNCISLPHHIMITRHRHTISLSYSLRQSQVEDWMCKICYKEVDIRYGNYRCRGSRCHYIAHVCCATDEAIWDGTIMPEGFDERSEEVVHEPWNLITDVVEQIRIGELMVASEIKHSYHDHNLRLSFSGKTKDDDSQCDGCTRPISTPFYSCEQCKFFLHKDCAELPKQMPHPFHKHLLTLLNSDNMIGDYSKCDACGRQYHGFSYRCHKGDCRFDIDIQCMLFSDTLKRPSHEHSLFLDHNNQGTSCSACFKTLDSGDVAYRCIKRCDFSLDVGCATLPLTVWYKYDRHPLTLTYSDYSEPSQHYCDLCEKEREPNRWFYHCADCDNSLHLNCALGDLPYMKLGNKLRFFHKHPLTVVKNIWNCPPCKRCGELCNGQALECKESECNFTIHWDCCISIGAFE
ncbi:hypothetical protein J1N35_013180 [Gossypium stocksii]|uniref:PHD-type domain-containing protein n=1 Tax=Gossypium stocksii TaxID=47602 RepID=A0A9D4A840_9ROSI|nr:hypothetical protein J1N35_013180 [Gossypium stocksii]